MSASLVTTATVILSQREQEYLLHAVEAAVQVDNARQFFLWTQGPLQALLPHQVLVALHFDGHDQLQHLECQHSMVLGAALRQQLAGRDDGLALRLARHCRQHACRSLLLDAADGADCMDGASAFRHALRALGFANLALHATGRLAGGSSVFVLLDVTQRPHARHAYFLALLLPHLHLMLQHLAHGSAAARASAGATVLARPLSAREVEILHWVREGKSNDEIGQILGISGLTVKNHLQRLYRLLGVSNRTHAIVRSAALRLFEPLARAA